MRNSRGFTLVEVMVALAVVAIALPALMVSLYQQVDNTAYLRDKSLASMVASNKLTEIRLLSRASASLFTGKDSGSVQIADRDWYWWVDSEATEVEQFSRITIRVAAQEEQGDQPLHRLVAFMSADFRSEPESEQDPDSDLGVGSGGRTTPDGGTGTAPRTRETPPAEPGN